MSCIAKFATRPCGVCRAIKTAALLARSSCAGSTGGLSISSISASRFTRACCVATASGFGVEAMSACAGRCGLGSGNPTAFKMAIAWRKSAPDGHPGKVASVLQHEKGGAGLRSRTVKLAGSKRARLSDHSIHHIHGRGARERHGNDVEHLAQVLAVIDPRWVR
jgi:hypothetical protein